MTLRAHYDADNIFAKIIRGDMPAIKVYEDSDALAFLDIFPQSRGHTLVVPKQHGATNFLDADPAMLSRLIGKVQHVAKGVVEALSPDGMRLMQFNGAPAGQTVFHLHFHIIPIFEGEALERHGGGKADMGELEMLAAAIRKALG